MIRGVVGRAFRIILLLCTHALHAQVDNPYHLNGTTSQDNCHCYTLTKETNNQSGSLWNVNKIDLTQSFDFRFTVFLGCKDADGADGLVFVLQPVSTSVGTLGGGLGYGGVAPSIGIAIDTWHNSENNDPPYDYISIQRNGNIVHGTGDDLTPQVTALASGDNIEDCKFHDFEVSWDATTMLLDTKIDGVERVSTTIDLVKDIFANDPMVFWGFTGSTGGSNNVQRVCTSLTPKFLVNRSTDTCYPAPMTFTDSSSSFGTISKWYWDFGDGVLDSTQNPPVHNYAAPGIYKVRLAIVGNDGCLSDSAVETITLGSKPLAAYGYQPVLPCNGAPVVISDSSHVAFGTIDQWEWSIAGQPYSVANPGSLPLSGSNRVELTVKTTEGCVSDKLVDSIVIRPLPCPEFYVPSAFSPNHDGHNDVFNFIAAGMLSVDVFKVYNRYGQVVYSIPGIKAAWDGRFKGIDQPSGTYAYIIEGRDFNGQMHVQKGTVVLVR